MYIMNTIKLFDESSYMTECEAEVISCTKTELGYELLLDRTCFFPTKGGQYHDNGTINGIRVDDVIERNDKIYHVIENKLETGTKVKCVIAWTERFSKMQQHSGEHVFTGLAHKFFGCDNVGFHLSDNVVTLDLNKLLSADDITFLEKACNDAIFEGHAIKAYYPKEQELSSIDYRCKGELIGQVRIVEIEGIDFCACCAPHVRNTSEIGILKVVKFEKYKGGVRVYILCGLRAFNYITDSMNILDAVSRNLKCGNNEIATRISKLSDDNKELNYRLSILLTQSIIEQARNQFDKDKIEVITEACNSDVMKNAANSIMKESDLPVYIYSNSDKGVDLCIASNKGQARELFEAFKAMGAKGGGSENMVFAHLDKLPK